MAAAHRAATRFAVHPGVYKDSLVLMQLQQRLLERPGVLEAGAAMASAANLELLTASGLLTETLPDLHAEDLLVVIRAETGEAAENALDSLEELLTVRASTTGSSFRPRSLDGALAQRPEARWALVSVPGRYAAQVTEEALERNLNVFLYSDNVEVGDEVRLKRRAAEKRLMVLGPDCGTAIVAGIGLGFANHVHRGPVGLVGGSGTGLQAVSVGIDALGGGVSQAIGTGGRDLSTKVGGIATRQALQVLADDPETRVIGLISKSPARAVAHQALEWAAACGKRVVVYLQGFEATSSTDGVHLATSLSDAAAMAVRLGGAIAPAAETSAPGPSTDDGAGGHRHGALLRGLFAGGTLAAETLLQLHEHLGPLYSNLEGRHWRQLDDVFTSHGHAIIDLGADELTRGRLHPMIDQETRLKRLRAEAADHDVELILLDVVLGEGAHADPAAELAPAIRAATSDAASDGRNLRVVALVIGTADDPQNLDDQVERLAAAGATVVFRVEDAVRYAQALATEDDPAVPMLPQKRGFEPQDVVPPAPAELRAVPGATFTPPLAAINIGLESFHDGLVAQGAAVVQVDWRPPAGGNERLAGILDRLRATQATEASRQ